MKKKYVSFQKFKQNLIEIDLKIDQSKCNPEIFVCI